VFEEAAGISRFRARKEEAEQRLKRSDENLVRVEDVVTDAQILSAKVDGTILL